MTKTSDRQAPARVVRIVRYPVKGMTGEALDSVIVEPNNALPFDRAYAIENGPGPFDPAAPAYVPKMHFVMLMRNEQLASLRAHFDDATHVLTLADAQGGIVAAGDLRDASGRATIEMAIAQTVTASVRAAPRIVSADGHSFSDVAAKCLHIINLASLRDLEARMGVAIDPLRFRPNLIVDGWAAWSELELIGKALGIGTARLDVFKRTERCAATNVDPETALRDLKIPSFLSRTFGHTDFGVYARVQTGGRIATGDTVSVAG